MHPVARLVRGTEGRPTRFHTGRGELMQARGWLDLPASLAARVRGREPAEPWFVPAAVRYLDSWLRAHPGARVLELGSGSSTAWFARRAGSVLSLEDDPAWEERTRSLLGAAGLENCELELVALADIAPRVAALPDESFDLVVVDCNEAPGAGRAEAARAALPKLAPGGILVFDDFDWPHLRAAEPLFAGMAARRFTGVKREPLTAAETAVFERPAGLRPS